MQHVLWEGGKEPLFVLMASADMPKRFVRCFGRLLKSCISWKPKIVPLGVWILPWVVVDWSSRKLPILWVVWEAIPSSLGRARFIDSHKNFLGSFKTDKFFKEKFRWADLNERLTQNMMDGLRFEFLKPCFLNLSSSFRETEPQMIASFNSRLHIRSIVRKVCFFSKIVMQNVCTNKEGRFFMQ